MPLDTIDDVASGVMGLTVVRWRRSENTRERHQAGADRQGDGNGAGSATVSFGAALATPNMASPKNRATIGVEF
jgi:hypothetical protein